MKFSPPSGTGWLKWALPLLLAPAALWGQGQPLDRIQVESRSGQFVVHGPSAGAVVPEAENSPFIRVTPSSLAIVCSRVRAVFNEQLRADDRWQDKIHVVIDPAMRRDADVVVTANRFVDSWIYSVRLPATIGREKLARCIVRVLLQELANRPSKGRPATIPLWLTEGMTRHALVNARTSLFPPVKERSAIAFDSGSVKIVENPAAPPLVFDSARYSDPLAEVKAQLAKFEALTFAEFGRAEDTTLSPEEWTLFQACSHLFVARLLELPGGQDAMRGQLAKAHEFLNWQLAFLAGYNAHFRSVLDVEKWWSLQVFNLSQPDLQSRLANLEGLDRLDAILDASVAVREPGTGEGDDGTAEREQFPLQVMMDLVEYPDQRAAIMDIVLRLRRLRWQVSEDLLKLTDDYAKELNDYVARRDEARGATGRKARLGANESLIVRQTLDRLKLLDVIRADTRELEEAAERERVRLRLLQQAQR